MVTPDPNKICKKLCLQYGIVSQPAIFPRKYSRRGARAILGQYLPDANQIHINGHILNEWPAKPMGEIISHELMHALCYQEIPGYDGNHGKEFKNICRSVNLPENIAGAFKK